MPASIENAFTSPAQGTLPARACHLLDQMTEATDGGDRWVYTPIPNKDEFGFSHMADATDHFRLTGQTLSLIETDPERFTGELIRKLRGSSIPIQDAPPEPIGPRDFTVESLEEFMKTAGPRSIIRVHAKVVGEYAYAQRHPLTVEIEQLKQQIVELQELNNQWSRNVTELKSGTSRWISGAEASVLTLEEDQRTLQRAESVELVTAMLAGAGFSLLRDPPGETAMWQQQLPTRPGVQVFFLLPVAEQELAPAELFAWVRGQVGVS